MPWNEQTVESYLQLEDLEAQWKWLSARANGHWSDAGSSVEGRPIPVISFGDSRRPTVLLSALMHGIELVGGLALIEVARQLLASEWPFHFVFMPIVNPDAVASNLHRLRQGRRASMRCNARGVDLNRNFAILNDRIPLHPFAGSRWPRSYHYIGPRPFSEPETQAVAEVARASRPVVSLGFHSFGNMLLYPWAYTKETNPRDDAYRRLGEAFCAAQPTETYDLRRARGLYPTVGDMDDWLDAELGTMAYTLELGRLEWSMLRPRRFFNPVYWMNPTKPQRTVANVVPAVVAMLEALASGFVEPPAQRMPWPRLQLVPQAAR